MSTPTANVVILAAHGSRAETANDAHRSLTDHIARSQHIRVLPAFLEMCDPSIGDAIDAAVDQGAHEIQVVPYFLHPGRHLTRDIPAIIDEARLRHPGIGLTMTAHVGSSDLLAQAVFEVLKETPDTTAVQ